MNQRHFWVVERLHPNGWELINAYRDRRSARERQEQSRQIFEGVKVRIVKYVPAQMALEVKK